MVVAGAPEPLKSADWLEILHTPELLRVLKLPDGMNFKAADVRNNSEILSPFATQVISAKLLKFKKELSKSGIVTV